MEVNPYAAPEASLDTRFIDELEARKATRGRRLAAAMLDGLFVGIMLLVSTLLGGLSGSRTIILVWWLLGLSLMMIVNVILLNRHGATLGKRVLRLQIVRTDGSSASLGRLLGLRFLPMFVLSFIPIIGSALPFIDSLMIFGNERRCLHDIFADTIVIDADD